MKIKKIAIIGQGQFGAFMKMHLEMHFEVVPFTRYSECRVLEDCDVVIFSVPFSSLDTVSKRIKKFVRKDAIIVDVTSVKQKPIALLQKHFKSHQILGTHPVFGPQSGKNGIQGLPIVLSNASCTKATYTKISFFLKNELGLQIIEQTPKQHDHEMANVQALTHFIGRALLNLQIKSYATNTKSYEQLLEVASLLKDDSWELFKTIQNTNPEAKKIRKQFLKELISLESALLKD